VTTYETFSTAECLSREFIMYVMYKPLKGLRTVTIYGTASTPAKAPPLSGVVCVPHCTAVLALSVMVEAFFLLYVEGGGTSSF
jgi:hypothetical protein